MDTVCHEQYPTEKYGELIRSEREEQAERVEAKHTNKQAYALKAPALAGAFYIRYLAPLSFEKLL